MFIRLEVKILTWGPHEGNHRKQGQRGDPMSEVSRRWIVVSNESEAS